MLTIPLTYSIAHGIGQAGRFVSQNAVQLHGGIGMTEELPVGHYFRRCMVIERLFGGETLPLVRHLIEDRGISHADLVELRQLIDRLERDRK